MYKRKQTKNEREETKEEKGPKLTYQNRREMV